MQALEPALRRGLDELGLSLRQVQITQLLDYLALIQKWGRVYNLTALREPEQMLTHHLLDSLAAVLPLRRQLAGRVETRLLDVGSGAGLPGVVIAICCPDLRVDCVDAVLKKASFIQHVALSLGLGHVRGLHARVEHLEASYPVVVSRAFASLQDYVAGSACALLPGGIWMAMKGKHPHDEIAALPAAIEVFHVEPLRVPHLDAQRCLVWMRRRHGA